MNRLSVRTRLLLLTLVLLATGLVVFGTVVVSSLRAPLVDHVDHRLSSSSELLSHIPPSTLDVVSGQTPRRPATIPDLISELHITYLAGDGTVQRVVRVGLDGEADPRLPSFTTVAAAVGGRPYDVESDSGRWRAVSVPARYPDAGDTTIVLAVPLDGVTAVTDRVRTTCLLVGASLLAALSVLGFFAVPAGLRPLRQIERTSAAIARGDLSLRVPAVAPPRTEVGRLAATMNGMLTRIETAVAARAGSEARMRRFVADASHELRTPLAGISGLVQLYRMGASTPEAALDRIERETARLTRLVADLFLLAQLDEAAAPVVKRAPMDLRAVAVDALHDLRALDPAREVTLTGPDGAVIGPATVHADEARLRQAVTNLIANAVAHTSPGTPVRIGVGTVDGHAVLEVADRGAGLTDEQARMVFERFYRTDESRSRRTGGAGLGLAITRSLVAAHGGDLTVRPTPGGGATFRIALPSTPP